VACCSSCSRDCSSKSHVAMDWGVRTADSQQGLSPFWRAAVLADVFNRNAGPNPDDDVIATSVWATAELASRLGDDMPLDPFEIVLHEPRGVAGCDAAVVTTPSDGPNPAPKPTTPTPTTPSPTPPKPTTPGSPGPTTPTPSRPTTPSDPEPSKPSTPTTPTTGTPNKPSDTPVPTDTPSGKASRCCLLKKASEG
jgi:hypothetical protein